MRKPAGSGTPVPESGAAMFARTVEALSSMWTMTRRLGFPALQQPLYRPAWPSRVRVSGAGTAGGWFDGQAGDRIGWCPVCREAWSANNSLSLLTGGFILMHYVMQYLMGRS